MRPDECGECGDDFVWDNDAGSAVCPSCGTLQDSSQVVLDSHVEPEDNAKSLSTFPFYHRATLKSFRNANGWDLAGQGSLPSVERNKIAMREYTTALALRLGYPSLTTRTLYLYELAMNRGHFQFGRKARLVAGASFAIALRENRKGETIKDIAYLLDESHVALARVFTAVVSLLAVKLVAVDPSWHLIALQKHLISVLAASTLPLPRILIKALNDIHLPSAFRTATSLSNALSRAGLFVDLPSPPTACAIYILALEGELLSSCPQCGELAKVLGSRFGVGKEVVMRRYKAIYEHVENWSAEIPWMKDLKTSASDKSVPKASRRVAVARCLKDTVQAQERLWKGKLEASGPLSVENVSSSENTSVRKVDLPQNDEAPSPRPRKRQKTKYSNDTSQFLLSPLHPSSSKSLRGHRVPALELEMASHMLTSDTYSFKKSPTRLQLLAAAKPVDDITDEELFGEGELDSLLRTAEERDVLIQTCDWARERDDIDGTDNEEPHIDHAWKRGFATRFNFETLDGSTNTQSLANWFENADKDDADDDNWTMSGLTGQIMTQDEHFDQCQRFKDGDDSQQAVSSAEDDECEILGPWMPMPSDSG